MSERTGTVASLDILGARTRYWLRLLAIGSGFGILAGASLFVHTVSESLSVLPESAALGLLFVIGALVHVGIRDLHDGITVSLIALAVGAGFAVFSYASPVFLLGYSGQVIPVFFVFLTGRAAASIYFVFPMTFYGGYLAALVTDALLFQ